MAKPKDSIKQIGYYAAALKAPPIRDSAARLAAQARDAGWTHEEYLAAMLSREVSSRESSGARTAGTGKTHLSIELGIAAAHHGHRVPLLPC